MSYGGSLYKHVLVGQSRLHRGLLVVPLAALGGGYSFAIVEPGAWDAMDSDRRSYASVEACLQAGMERVELYMSQLSPRLSMILDRAEDCADGNQVCGQDDSRWAIAWG